MPTLTKVSLPFNLLYTSVLIPVCEGMRSTYAKATARLQRWNEEVLWLKEEMRRTVEYLRWKASWWEQRAHMRQIVDPTLASGLDAYAYRQSSVYVGLADKFQTMWTSTLAKKGHTVAWRKAARYAPHLELSVNSSDTHPEHHPPSDATSLSFPSSTITPPASTTSLDQRPPSRTATPVVDGATQPDLTQASRDLQTSSQRPVGLDEGEKIGDDNTVGSDNAEIDDEESESDGISGYGYRRAHGLGFGTVDSGASDSD